ncbi:helix-turn-helix domain-containing protein [Roseobacter sp. YSTF-M11]|uniref:Helix-turn-helix domain-containing protein n=1 Tax=Roseobacter insulae TaxID=2859783 RepID=A0A9X1FYD8_9RHOB|nr:helix-turn-helix domain-containing protein [Roseobacter insulae]MBW4709193.1 helix-turn-helix domain-containing protein [Roseobacter insulae]
MPKDAKTPFEKWYDDLHSVCGHYDGVPHRRQQDVNGRVDLHRFGLLDVADVSGDVAMISRDRAGIRRDESEYIFFVLDVAGIMNVDHRDRQSALRPGDSILLDSTREASLHLAQSSSRLLSVHLPRQSFLCRRRGGLELGKRLPRDHPLASALIRRIRPLAAGTSDETRLISPSLLYDTIHAAFSGAGRAISDIDLTHDADRFELITDLVDCHLADECLTLDWLAAQVGLSARQLQRVLRDHDTSFTTMVREKRYRYVTEHLQQHADPHGRIAEIAFCAGFRDLSNFNRGFKAFFGMSPRSYHRTRQEAARRMA